MAVVPGPKTLTDIKCYRGKKSAKFKKKRKLFSKATPLSRSIRDLYSTSHPDDGVVDSDNK